MKIRQGFVSNSSTSSFIIVGFRATADKLHEMLGADCDIDSCLFRSSHCIYDECSDDYVIGSMVSYDNEDGCESISDLADRAEEVSQEFDIPLSEIELHYGVIQT